MQLVNVMAVKSKKSKGFDDNLNSKILTKNIEKNLYKSNEIFKDTANLIAPIKTGALRNSTKQKTTGFKITVSWNRAYAKVRYYFNKLNPQTTEWILKAWKKKKKVLLNIMKDIYKK